jgi:hypothetical protein
MRCDRERRISHGKQVPKSALDDVMTPDRNGDNQKAADVTSIQLVDLMQIRTRNDLQH